MHLVTSTDDMQSMEAQLMGYFTKDFYHKALIPLLVLTIILAWLARPSTSEVIPAGYRKFQLQYLSVWVFCVGADWLQGPYVYALYSAYGFEKKVIAQLFVAGFVASGIFGCFVGSVSDKFGRKNSALAYVLLYIVSCLTKHFKSYGILMLGRITGGMATSLLFSCFECWMVSEHQQRNKFSDGLLGYMFGLMFQCMYGTAIIAGLVGQVVADAKKFEPMSEGSMLYWGGDLGPFDLSILCLIIGGVLIMAFWKENYGGNQEGENSASTRELFSDAMNLLMRDKRTLLLCLVVACFEGSMFSFVFNWTPALSSDKVPPPFGLIFALFMMACMCGASVSTLAGSVKTSTKLGATMLLGVVALGVPAGICGQKGDHLLICFIAFLVFEFCVGVYFPSIGVVKSEIVPERVRSTMYNLYRVPLNIIVVCLLLSNISMTSVYATCAVLLGVAFVGNTLIAAPTPLKEVPAGMKEALAKEV